MSSGYVASKNAVQVGAGAAGSSETDVTGFQNNTFPAGLL